MSGLTVLNDQPRLRHAFSTVADGNLSYTWGEVDPVAAARRTFLEKIGWKLEDCIGMALDHQGRMEVVSASDRGRDMVPPFEGEPVDALMTDSPNLPLFMLSGDCLPCVIHDPVQPAVVLAHLSSRTAESGLATAVIQRMAETYGSRPQDLVIGIGPGIRKESYLLPRFDQTALPEWQPYLEVYEDGSVRVDLAGFVASRFQEAGVPAENIQVSPVDTATDTTYFSHYRSKRSGKPEARFATVTWMTA